MMVNDSKSNIEKSSIYLILLSGLAILIGMYVLLRFAGWWGESDTAVFTKTIASMLESGKLIHPGKVYQNGYGYQALILWLATITGLHLGVLQISIGTLFVVWVVIPAWLAYRELTRSELAASLSTLILLIQPELIFPLLRGTHEKFTRGLMFLGLYLLLHSLRARGLRLTTLYVICFYLCAYAMVSFNAFMATSFILGIILALGLVWFSNKRDSQVRQADTLVISKLVYVTASLLVIAFIFMFYVYTPAQAQLRVLQSIADRVALLALQVEDAASNPYQVVNTGWVSPPVYYLVSMANWLLLGLSLVLWLRQSYAWLIKRSFQPARHEVLLWAFYAAFAFLGFSSIVVDISGALSANLQHRMFPSFVMLAAPVAGAWLAGIKLFGNQRHKMIWAGASLALGILMLLSVIKATNEPLLSNYWLFYTPAEHQSIAWAEQNLTQRVLWIGLWGRVSDGYIIWENGRQLEIELNAYSPRINTHNYLVSEAERLYTQQVGSQLPIKVDSLITYDNGAAQIYHRRPVTPFQK